MKRTIGYIIVGLSVWGGISAANFGLSADAACGLGALLCAIVWWVTKAIPDYAAALLMCAAFILCAHVPAQVVFSAFSGSTWWLLMSAFGLGLGMSKCGLLRRMAVGILRLFPRSYAARVLALLTVGTLTAPFVPSLSAKAAMLSPLTDSIGLTMGYSRSEKAYHGLFLAMLTGLRNPAPLFISASVIGYALLGQYGVNYTMGQWFLWALPWFLTVTVLNFILLVKLYGPEGGEDSSAGGALPELPPMSAGERYMLVIICGTMGLWVTESLHGIPAYLVSIVALALTAGGNVFTAKEFCSEINWNYVLFIGCVLGIAPVFSHLGIDVWLPTVFRPLLTAVAREPLLFLLMLCPLTVIMRFAIVSEIAYINIVLPFLLPLAAALGISPWVVGFAAYCFISPWFVLYQNPVYMAAYNAAPRGPGDHPAYARYCGVYLITCLIGILVSLPYWHIFGLL